MYEKNFTFCDVYNDSCTICEMYSLSFLNDVIQTSNYVIYLFSKHLITSLTFK